MTNSTPPPTDAISELMEAHGKTTKGEWTAVADGYRGHEIHCGLGENEIFNAVAYAYGEADAKFICLAYNLLPSLAEQIQALQAIKDKVAEYLEALEVYRVQGGTPEYWKAENAKSALRNLLKENPNEQ